jgi:hypothetical protein
MDAPRLTKTIGHARSGSRRRVLDGEFDSPPSPPIHFRPPSSAGGLAGTLQCQCATLRARSARQGGSFNTARAQGRPKWHHSVPDPFPGAPALRSWRLRRAPTGCPLNQLLATISVRGTRPPPYGRSKPASAIARGPSGPSAEAREDRPQRVAGVSPLAASRWATRSRSSAICADSCRRPTISHRTNRAIAQRTPTSTTKFRIPTMTQIAVPNNDAST